MDSEDISRLIYLILLGCAVVGWFIAENRDSLGRVARISLIWAMIFVGLVAGFGLWEDVRQDLLPRQAVLTDVGAIEVPRQSDGHFHMTLDINDVPISFLIDTGASDIVMSLDDARRAGLDPDNLAFAGSARTANGVVPTAYTHVDDIAVGPVVFDGVRIAVNGGEMRGSLLGMSFLSRFSKLEIENNRLRLSY